jgi:hypothetical protein
MDLALRVAWHWGGSKVIRTSSTFPIYAALAPHGFISLPSALLVVAHRDRFVDPQFTFCHYAIRSGDLLVCALRRLPTREKSWRFLESLFPRRLPADPARDDDERSAWQVAHLSDLEFMSKEGRSDFPVILNEMLREQDEEESDDTQEPTVLAAASKIAEDPLPRPYQLEAIVAWKAARFGRTANGELN